VVRRTSREVDQFQRGLLVRRTSGKEDRWQGEKFRGGSVAKRTSVGETNCEVDQC
jgi:hypothetical protein